MSTRQGPLRTCCNPHSCSLSTAWVRREGATYMRSRTATFIRHARLRFRNLERSMAVSFTLNGKPTALDVDPNMPLLWAIREAVGLTGTKFGCGVAQCGACTVHIEGQATRSCVTPVSAVA